MTFTMGPALLFCPADRPDRFEKAAERSDAVILDLEDAVAPDARARAREHVATSDLDPGRTIVRVNAVGSDDHLRDLDAVARSGYRTVMLAKCAGPEDVAGLGGLDVVALVEAAAGVQHVGQIAATPPVVALMWGAEDLMTSLGGTSSRRLDGGYRDVARYARAATLVAAGAAGRAAIDAVHLDLGDLEGLAAEAEDAAAQGFRATACLHPAQVRVVRDAYRPDPAAVDRARRLLAAAGGRAVFAFEGAMVDAPVLAHAAEVLRRAGASPG